MASAAHGEPEGDDMVTYVGSMSFTEKGMETVKADRAEGTS
jgi:hypothetical protein